MSQPVRYDENNFDKNFNLEDILNTNNDSDVGCFVEVDLSYPDNTRRKTKHFPSARVKKIDLDDFSDYMKKTKPDTYTQTKRLNCDWSDKKN